MIDEDEAMKDGVKECYVFENKEDPNCPIIFHFPLVNEDFREYKAPGGYSKSECLTLCWISIFHILDFYHIFQN